MQHRIPEPLGLLTPGGVERDPVFRDQITLRTRLGMRAVGLLGLIGPAILFLGQLVLDHWTFVWTLDASSRTLTGWIPISGLSVGALILVLAHTAIGSRWGRLIVALGAVIMTVLVPLDYMAAGGHHPSKYGILALFMLVTIGTMPFRAWHTALLGSTITITYGLMALLVPGLYGHNPLNLIPEFPVFMIALTGVCTGISALVYQGRYRHFLASRDEVELRQRIAESEKNYRSLFENSSDGIFVYSEAEHGFLMVNHVVESMLGVSAEELAQTKFTDIVHDDDLERVKEYRAASQRGDEVPGRYMVKLKSRSSDEPVICDVTIHRSDDPTITTGAIRDITSHIKMEEENRQLAQLPESNPFPVLRYDYDGKLLYMNPAARRFPMEIGHPEISVFDLLPDDFEDRIKTLIDSDTTILDSRHDVIGHTFSVTYRPLPGCQELFFWLVDVTERIKDEERVRAYASQLEKVNLELREMQAQLVQSEKMAALGNLVAGVAHEINTPVGSIHANADLSRRALEIVHAAHQNGSCKLESDAEVKFERAIKILTESNATTRTATDRIVGIVRSLRNFARLDEAELKDVDLHEGIESSLSLVYHEYKNRVEIVRKFGELPHVRCYPNQLNQVFMNILVNAIHAIDGDGTITITSRSAGDKVIISFQDTGRGIDDESLARIFDPGFTTKGVGVGTGLGLSIVYKIIEAHKGTIDVKSSVGEGSTFTLTIPVQPPSDPALAEGPT